MGSSSVNLIIPVQGAEGPAGEKTTIYIKKRILSNVAACEQDSGVSRTSEAGSIRGIHSNHGLRNTWGTADSCLVHGPHPECVGAPLHQPCHREAGVLNWVVITLSPVVGAHLTPATQKNVSVTSNTVIQLSTIMYKSISTAILLSHTVHWFDLPTYLPTQ